jgi:hypothetical protein
MKKFFLIEQPPISEKYRMLVDKLTEVKNFGNTNDIDKIEYNLNIIGKDFSDRVDIHNLFTDKGITAVFPLGTYIVVLEMKKDKTKGKMSFFDFDNIADISKVRGLLEMEFSEYIISEWFRIYYLLESEFSEEEDLVELIVEPN